MRCRLERPAEQENAASAGRARKGLRRSKYMGVHYAEKDIERILLSEEEIRKRVSELGRQISEDYKDRDLVAVCVLRGCVMFFSDLMRQVTIPAAMEFMSVSSYGGGTQSSGSVRIKYDLENDIAGKDVLIVEDIIDSGNTLSHLTDMLRSRRPNSIEICCLLDKPDRRVVDVPVRYTGFRIPDEFVVGYGLDYDSKYRNYCNIGILKEEVYR